jgi:hypothetical protein
LEDNSKKFPKPSAPEALEATGKRRVAKIVHDDRGAASVEWHDAPEDYERPVLELEKPTITRNSKVRGGIEVLHIKHDTTFNPYENQPERRKSQGGGARRDLRKLSEHIKLLRELEERKKRGEEE